MYTSSVYIHLAKTGGQVDLVKEGSSLLCVVLHHQQVGVGLVPWLRSHSQCFYYMLLVKERHGVGPNLILKPSLPGELSTQLPFKILILQQGLRVIKLSGLELNF